MDAELGKARAAVERDHRPAEHEPHLEQQIGKGEDERRRGGGLAIERPRPRGCAREQPGGERRQEVTHDQRVEDRAAGDDLGAQQRIVHEAKSEHADDRRECADGDQRDTPEGRCRAAGRCDAGRDDEAEGRVEAELGEARAKLEGDRLAVEEHARLHDEVADAERERYGAGPAPVPGGPRLPREDREQAGEQSGQQVAEQECVQDRPAFDGLARQQRIPAHAEADHREPHADRAGGERGDTEHHIRT